MTFKERYQYNPQKDLAGKGGFSRVYRATDTLLGRTVALKFFEKEIDEKHTLIKEISSVIQLDHPNLCRYYDAAIVESTNVHGEPEKIEVGVMEYLDGGDIKTYLKQNREQIDRLLTEVLEGLSFLHQNGIIHRDLKAQNILIKNTAGGPVAKIADFGISKRAGTDNGTSSALLGTIEYMAPEQFNPAKYGINGKLATNLDFWHFGLLVYEIIMNEKLFSSSENETGTARVMSRILEEDNSEKIEYLPEPYKAIVKKCLVKHAAQRVQKADELIALLKDKKMPLPIYENKTKVLTNIEEKKQQLYTEQAVVIPNPETQPGSGWGDGLTGRRSRKFIYTIVISVVVFLSLAILLFGKYSNSREMADEPFPDESLVVNPPEDSLSTINQVVEEPYEKEPQSATTQSESNKTTVIVRKETPDNIPEKRICNACRGKGTIISYITCPQCNGANYLKCDYYYATWSVNCIAGKLNCPKCSGSGICTKIYKACEGSGKCKSCDGTGEIYSVTSSGNLKYYYRKCLLCKGTGICYLCKNSGNCQQCEGSGQMNCTKCNGTGIMECNTCNRIGKISDKTKICAECHGEGVL